MDNGGDQGAASSLTRAKQRGGAKPKEAAHLQPDFCYKHGCYILQQEAYVLRYQAEFLYPPLLKKLVLVNNLLCRIKHRRQHYNPYRTSFESDLHFIGP